MNDTFNKEFTALLVEMGMSESMAPLQADIMSQLLTKNPSTTTILLQAFDNGDTQGARDILVELFEASGKWIINYFQENKEEILQELAGEVWEHFNK